MDRLERSAVVARLVELLRERDGWAGETQVQKSVYFLEKLLAVPAGWKFTLYKFGPFSFELRDDLAEMQSDGFLCLERQRPPYGPRLAPGASYAVLKAAFEQVLDKHQARLEFVADHLGRKDVAGLERIATALFVTDDLEIKDPVEQVAKLTEIKPHVAPDEAEFAFAELAEIRRSLPAT